MWERNVTMRKRAFGRGDRLNRVFDGATIDPYPHQFSMYLTLEVVNTSRYTPSTRLVTAPCRRP